MSTGDLRLDPTPRGTLRWFKMAAGGNDFIVVDGTGGASFGLSEADVRRACTPRHSIGADGLILLGPSDRATARFELWNRDGSRAALSGNGARCAARVLHLVGMSSRGHVSLETAEGVVPAHVLLPDEQGRVLVELDLPAPRDVRFGLELPAGSPVPSGDYGVVGVPYLCLPVDDVDEVDLDDVAPPLRRWRELPDGANVAIYELPRTGRTAIRMRTFERGVEGETLSSGTGCGMTAISAAFRTGALADDGPLRYELVTRSRLPLAITLARRGGEVEALRLTGDARFVAELSLGPEALTGFS